MSENKNYKRYLFKKRMYRKMFERKKRTGRLRLEFLKSLGITSISKEKEFWNE